MPPTVGHSWIRGLLKDFSKQILDQSLFLISIHLMQHNVDTTAAYVRVFFGDNFAWPQHNRLFRAYWLITNYILHIIGDNRNLNRISSTGFFKCLRKVDEAVKT